ncbi:hypothetical protein N7444_010552 [Penicillium canescens]|nr:hypothetical protein N7444_010552 [Penicillium canescens]
MANSMPAPMANSMPAPMANSMPAPMANSMPAPMANSMPAPMANSMPAPMANSMPAPMANSMPAPMANSTARQLTHSLPTRVARPSIPTHAISQFQRLDREREVVREVAQAGHQEIATGVNFYNNRPNYGWDDAGFVHSVDWMTSMIYTSAGPRPSTAMNHRKAGGYGYAGRSNMTHSVVVTGVECRSPFAVDS